MTTGPSLPTTPATVEPGQIWKNNDQRTVGAGEFTVLEVDNGYALVQRHHTGATRRILVERLLRGTTTQRGYTYLGQKA